MADYQWQEKASNKFWRAAISAIIAACGTGKTRACIRLALRKMLPIIVIVPKNATRVWADEIREIVGPNEKIWIHDVVKETRNTEKYRAEFLAWLQPTKEDTIIAEARKRSFT